MKRLVFILVLMVSTLTSINSHGIKKITVLIPSFVKTMMIDEVPVTATRLAKPEIPESFIADYIFDKQLYVESRHKHLVRGVDGKLKLIESPAGALGIAQFLPSTWEWLKTKKVLPKNFSIDRESHQRAAQRLYMNRLAKRDYGIKYNKVKLALASYNAGSGRVLRLIRKYGLDWETHLPRETKNYIKIIMG